jgi:integrase
MSIFHTCRINEELTLELPTLPAIIRYYDEFSDSFFVVGNPEDDRWELRCDGQVVSLNFSRIDVRVRDVIRNCCGLILARRTVRTTQERFWGLKAIPPDLFIQLLLSKPETIRLLWKIFCSSGLPRHCLTAAKSLLFYLCFLSIGGWSRAWTGILDQLPLPHRDKYAGIRTGDVFLRADEELELVRCIDDVAHRVRKQHRSTVDFRVIETAILVCSYQFGMRCKQIAMLQTRDVRLWDDGIEKTPAVHLTFRMIKQRSGDRVLPLLRVVKREWAPIFYKVFTNAKEKGLTGTDHLFACTPLEIGEVVMRTTRKVLGRSRTVRELRHTAAQRMVDAGATEEELAEFLGHTNLNSGLIYFRHSASQAERVNRALGISPIYQRIASVAHGGFISPQELRKLKGEQQIGGVPHGLPITGIGGCASGQPACPYNPVTSCYGCRKFMPVNDVSVHRRVLADFRSIVKFFVEASRDEVASPAYLQLQRTITGVQGVIEELEGHGHE